METYIRSEQTKSLHQGGEIQNGDTGNHQDIPPTRGVGHLNRFQGRLLPYTYTGTVQEISEISCPGSDIPIQSSAFRSVHSTLGVHCSSKGGEADDHTQGYKDPPVPRRLVGESQIPPGLSLTHSRSSEDMPRTRLAGEFRKIRTGTKADFRFCRLPGPTYTGPLAESPGQNTRNTVTTGLSGPVVHVPDRFVNSHRKASSPRLIAHETHTVASQKLEGARITTKGDPNSQVPAPPLTMVGKRRQCSHRPTITPNKTCSANIYKHIKGRVGRSLKRIHCKRVLVTARKQAAYQLSGTKSSLSSSERVPRPLYRQDSTCSNRQHYSSVIHKQIGKHEVWPTLCPIVENLDLVYQKANNSQSTTHSRTAERGSRQAIQTRPDHPNRVVPPSRGFPSNMQKVAPASNRPFCHEVQQVASICVTGTGSLGHSSGCTQSAMGGSERICLPTSSRLGQSGGEVAGLSMQENHSDCSRVAQRCADRISNCPLDRMY